MPEEYDFSELRKYLRGQIDMGEADLCLDEPWTLVKPSQRAVPAAKAPNPVMAPELSVRPVPVSPVPAAPAVEASAMAPAGETLFDVPVSAGVALPAARSAVKKTAAAFESAESLEAFYAAIKTDVVYANVADFVLYEGPATPKVLLLLPAPPAQPGSFFATPAGEMLVRLFGSLSVPAESIGVTFFYKGRVARNIPALLEASLRKMLTKELSFIAPSVMVTFGEPLFHQVFGKGKNFEELAGTDLSFSGVKTCSLVDAYAMAQDKQLKWVTWKVHIPKSSYFKV